MTTRAVLLARTRRTDGEGPACLLQVGGQALLVNIAAKVESLGACDTEIITEPQWQHEIEATLDSGGVIADVVGSESDAETLAHMHRTLGRAEEESVPTLLIEADIVTHRGSLANLLRDPRIHSGFLTTTEDVRDAAFSLSLDRGRVVDCESPYHRVEPGQAWFLEAVKVDAEDAGAAACAATTAASLVQVRPEAWEAERSRKVIEWPNADDRNESALNRPNALVLLAAALVRDGQELRTAPLRKLHWSRPSNEATAKASANALEEIDEDRVQLDSAVKAKDGFFTTFFVSSYSKYIVREAARAGFTPNQITVFSLLLGLAAAIAFAFGTLPARVIGAVLLQLAFTFDCVDGQLARYTMNFSAFGAWLDSMFDRAKEYLVFAGLAYGAVRTGGDEFVWLLAAGALAAQGVRHLLDFSYAAASPREAREITQPALVVVDGPSCSATVRHQTSSPIVLANRLETTWLRWPKRMITLPIGERFALISITAAIWGAEVTFAALLIWGGLAALYSTTGRILRTLT